MASSSNISARSHHVILTYDEPECGGAADALTDMIHKEAKAEAERLNIPPIVVNPIAITHGSTHRDTLHRCIQELFNVHTQDVFVISLLKGGNAVEYQQCKELCSQTKPKLQHQIVSHLSGFTDVGLVLRNLVRKVMQSVYDTDAGSQERRKDDRIY